MNAFFAIARFELQKRRRMLSTYVYFAVLTTLGFLAILAAGGAFSNVSVGMGSGKVLANSPHALFGLFTLLGHFALLINAAVFGQAIFQDWDNGTHSFLFSYPVPRVAYVFGRFVGALTFSVLLTTSFALGALAATHTPFVEASLLGPNRFAYYAWPYLVEVIPNVAFTGALFFALGTLGRRMMPVYVGAVLLVIGYMTAGALFSKIELRSVAALVDPFGLNATRLTTQYWTVDEKNTRLVPLSGLILANRTFWLAIGAGLLALAATRFRMVHHAPADAKSVDAKGEKDSLAETRQRATASLPVVQLSDGVTLSDVIRATWLSFRETVKNAYFGVIALAGVLFMIVAIVQSESMYGTHVYPVTHSVVERAGGSFSLFIIILGTFYAGELVWRERDAKISAILDALPTPTWLPFVTKLATLLALNVVLLAVIMICGLTMQTLKGYHHYEISLYVRELFVLRLVDFSMLTVLAFAVHVIVQNKYVGHFVMVLYYVSTLFMTKLGLEHNLYTFNGSPAYVYSDMNGYGHFLRPVFWFDLYWALFSVLLAFACHLLWQRGVDSNVSARLREAKRRLGARLVVVFAATFASFVGVGSFIFYNTNVLNHYETSHDGEALRAKHEKTYKRILKEPQPRVTDVSLAIDIVPETQSLRARGTYMLTNKSGKDISVVYVNLPSRQPFATLQLGTTTEPTKRDVELGVYTFALTSPMKAGEARPLTFDITFHEDGFKNGPMQHAIVANGTFFNNGALPNIGYDERGEISDEATRKKYGLAPKLRMPALMDLEARNNNYIVADADFVSFEATVTTAPDQVAIAPGYLTREWTENGRRAFHYKMDAPILHFFSVLSARYAKKVDRWNDVALEIYYHPEHTYDLDAMMAGMKDTLEYCSRAFGPYQHKQARIVEFPRYDVFAQSFPNTIPYSEAIGFIAKVDPKDPEDVDYPYYVTAHEIAHQWWAHQVVGANVQGATATSETMAQYTALMVMKKKYGPDRMRRFLRYELDKYLRGRGTEGKRELPLMRVENQGYIHYNKGSIVMYGLADDLGEHTVNRALSAFLTRVKFQGPPYTTALELVQELKRVAPAEKRSLIEDGFEHITLYDNLTESASCVEEGGRAKVTVKTKAKKFRADDLGRETEVPMEEMLDIGAVDADGNALFLEKQRVTSGASEHTFEMDRCPPKAGIDPLNKRIDRTPSDNLVRVSR